MDDPGSGRPTTPLSERLTPLFADAVARFSGGDRYEWDLGPFTVPEPETGLAKACVLFQLWAPSAVLGQWLSQTVLVTDPHVAVQEGIDSIVRGAFETMAQARSRILAASNGKRT